MIPVGSSFPRRRSPRVGSGKLKIPRSGSGDRRVTGEPVNHLFDHQFTGEQEEEQELKPAFTCF